MTTNTSVTLRGAIFVALGLLLFASTISAQKKGAGAATPAASPAAAPATTASNAPFEVEMLSYSALDQILEKLAKYACKVPPVPPAGGESKKFGKVVILDTPSLQALQSYDAFTANAQALVSAFNRMLDPAGAGSGIDDFSDITNAVAAAATASNSESSFSFTIQDPTAAIALLSHLRGQAPEVCKDAYYAGVYTANEISKPMLHATPINSVSKELDGLSKLRTKTLSDIVGAGESTAAATRKRVACAPIPTTLLAGLPAPIYAFGASDPCLAAFNNLDGTYNSFLAGLSTPNATTGQPALSSILQGYRLRALFSTATLDSPMLGIYISVAAAGGTQQDRKNLLTNLFTGDWIRYSGGVSVNLIVFQVANGKTAQEDVSRILFSDLIRYRTPLGQIRKPNGYDHSAEAGDNLGKIPEE